MEIPVNRNVKGGRRGYPPRRGSREVPHNKISEYSISRKYMSCDKFSSAFFGGNTASGIGRDREVVELPERCQSGSKKSGKISFEQVLPSAGDSEPSGMLHYYGMKRHLKSRERTSEFVVGDRSPMCSLPVSSRNTDMYERSPVLHRKGSNKHFEKRFPAQRNLDCADDPRDFMYHSNADEQRKQVVSSGSTVKLKLPIVINESYDYDSSTGSSASFTSSFVSHERVSNKDRLLNENSRNTVNTKTSVFRNPNNDSYSDSDLHESTNLFAHNEDPHTIVSKCRTKINRLSDLCYKNYGKELGNMSVQINGAKDNKDTLHVLSDRKANISVQHKCFNDFILHMQEKLTELYGEYNTDVVRVETEEILSKVKDECKLFSSMSHAYSLKRVLKTALVNCQVVVVSCDVTYCSNIVIPLLLQSTFKSGMIASCEVNAAAALFSAQKCCYLMDKKFGQLVGYDIGQEILRSKNTKIIYTTIQELFSYSLNDPLFSKYSYIVLNDFLYRSIEADILLASLRQCINKRGDLRIVILVASQRNVENFKCFFSRSNGDKVSVINTEKLSFPVQVIWKQSLCNPDDDVITEAVNICFSIHVMKTNDRRNVLVFLPTEEDAVKVAELTTQKFFEYSFTDVFCIYINEKIKIRKILEIWKQQQSKRVIMFVNSGFEVVSLPNVHYVVDFGRTCEVSYDTEKKIEVQKMSFISRHRAEMRKKCAGVYTSGTCFRMYSKQNYKKSMACNELPEVLSRSPLNSIIKILKFKPNSSLAVEFIESFSEQVKENALSALQSLGALKNGRLTQFGECLIKLPFPPECSKLIILGKQQGLLFEVVILVSFFSVELGNVFKSGSTEDLQKKIDAAKLHFLLNDSDTLTFFNIYRQWIESNYSESWCTNNYIEYSFLDCVRTKIKEVRETVEKSLGENVPDKHNNDYRITPDVCSSLQQLIFECFRDNLCIHSGHFTTGYRSLTAHCNVFLHPSTFITEKRSLPQFIVYNRFVSKTHNFITHITAIPDSYVIDAFDHGLLKVKRAALFDQKLVPHVIGPVGLSVIKYALTREKIRELEEQIKRETESEFIVIEPSEEKGSVSVYCLPGNWGEAKEIMRQFLDENMEKVWDEEETQVLELQKGSSTVSVNIVWSKGAAISSVVVDTEQETICVSESGLSCDGTISACETNTAHSSHSCIVLTWPRRPCLGDGFVEFNNSEDFSKARKLAIKVKGADAGVEFITCQKYQLFVNGLDPDTTEEDLKMAFQDKLAGISLSNVKVRRLPPFETNSDDIEAIKIEFREQFYQNFGRNVVNIEIHKPENADIIMSAEFQPSGTLNMYSLKDLATFLNGSLKIRDIKVKARASYYSSLFCSIDIWEKVEHSIYRAYNVFEQKLKKSDMSCDIEVKASDYQTQRLKISSENEENVAELRKIVQGLLEGCIVTSADNKCLPMLFCYGGQLFLHALKNKANVYIIDDYRTKTIRLYGSEENCKVAKSLIMEYLRNVEEETVLIVSLDRGQNSRTLLRHLIQTYGVELKQFIEVCKLRSAELNIQKCELTLYGSVESIQKAESLLGELEESGLDYAPDPSFEQEKCPTCFETVFTRAIRLESCGHLYCRICSTVMVTKSEIPVKCYVVECQKVIILEDIRRILDNDTEKIKELLKKSLKHFISCNSKFAYCPAPDCPMFVDKENIPDSKWNCPLCHNDICWKCNVIYHGIYTCDAYQKSKTDPNFDFEAWRENNQDCKQCPSCSAVIQKTGGCNDMLCYSCKSHFCWACRTPFETSMDVLFHQKTCKGGS